MYLFHKVGEITVKKDGKVMDELIEMALEVGADDVEDAGEVAFFYTNPTNLFDIKNKLAEKGLVIENAELSFKPLTPLTVAQEDEEKLFAFIEKLEDLGDVQKVSTSLA